MPHTQRTGADCLAPPHPTSTPPVKLRVACNNYPVLRRWSRLWAAVDSIRPDPGGGRDFLLLCAAATTTLHGMAGGKR
jgi:hypothetical protein